MENENNEEKLEEETPAETVPEQPEGSQIPEPPEEPEPPQIPEEPYRYQQPIPNPMTFTGRPEYIPHKKKKSKKIIVAVVLIVCVSLITGASGFLLGLGFINAVEHESSSIADASIVIEETSKEVMGGDYSVEVADPAEIYSTKNIAKLTVDSVVEITTEMVSTSIFMQQYITKGAGSGVIISEDGYIVTNEHVIEGARAITVRLRNGEEYDATLIGADYDADIAIVKIEANGLRKATLGNSDLMEVGDPVIAIGNPLGRLGGTVTEGIISALGRNVIVEDRKMVLLQHSAAISPGNSGGGLFNASGQLVAIVNAGPSSSEAENIGFAIPINTAVPVINDIMNYGYVRGKISLGAEYIGIYSDYYAYYYGVSEYGTYISTVENGSDADTAGLRSGDRIDTVNGTQITSAEVFEKIIEECKVGDTLKIEFTRFKKSGKTYTSEQIETTLVFTEYIP